VCDTGRYQCPYYGWGEGPPLVFIPGIADDALSFVLPIAHLSRHFRCVAYDLPTGAGDGARLSGYRHGDYAADLFALLDHLGAPQSYVFGSSFGATVALAALHAQPRRLPRAVLQGGFARRPLASAEIQLARFARYRTPDLWNFYLTRCGSPPTAAVAQRALLVHQIDLRRLLPAIHQPVLLVCGDCDPLVNRACEAALLEGLPSASRVELRNCGHLPQYTHPEVLAELAYRFLMPLPCAG
jgi:pimeloyl-ACP methyl ester carboxylesterase